MLLEILYAGRLLRLTELCKDVQPEVKGASLAVPEAEQGSCCGLIALSPLL